MSFQEDIYDHIEAYLKGQLDGDQLVAFEKEISLSASLQDEIEKHKTVNALIVEQRLLSVKDLLQAEKIKDTNKGSTLNSYVYLAIAVAGIGVGSYMLMDTKVEVVTKDVVELPNVVQSDSSNSGKNVIGKSIGYLKNTEAVNTFQTENGFRKSQIQFVEQQINESAQNIKSQDTAMVVNQKTKENPTSVETKSISNTESTIVVPADPCEKVFIQASVKTNPTCVEDNNGTILVHSIQGGKKPYSITLHSSNNESITNGSLPTGTYQAIVTDADGCIQTYSNIVVSEKDCPKDYSFNPYIGEEWNLEAHDLTGTLEMRDKAGMLYYQSTISAHTPLHWSGMGSSNQIIPGYYIFVIKYSDGTYKRGSVTIVQ
jgi:hypothetical protein